MLNIISLGLSGKNDVSVKGVELCKKSDKVYIETYTNYFNSSTKELSEFFGKEVIEITRNLLEEESKKIIEEAKKENVSLLVPGDCFSATTHISILIEAKKENVNVNIVHGSSIFTAVAETGLSLYNFGKVTTIPFDNSNIKSPIEALKNNKKLEMHTLFLLDVKDKKYMTISKGLNYLRENNVSGEELCIGCAGLGSEKKEIKYGKINEIKKIKFNSYPQCFIIPGKLHFAEKEALELFKQY